MPPPLARRRLSRQGKLGGEDGKIDVPSGGFVAASDADECGEIRAGAVLRIAVHFAGAAIAAFAELVAGDASRENFGGGFNAFGLD